MSQAEIKLSIMSERLAFDQLLKTLGPIFSLSFKKPMHYGCRSSLPPAVCLLKRGQLDVPCIQSCNRIDMTEFPYFAPSGLFLSYETGAPEQREKW